MRDLILITTLFLLSFTNIYASFPVVSDSSDSTIMFNEEINLADERLTSRNGTASLILGLLWLPLLVCGIILAFSGLEFLSIFFFIAAVVAFFGASILGIIALSKNEPNKIKAYIGIGMTLGLLLFSILSSEFDFPFY